jgi:hypothetical protein
VPAVLVMDVAGGPGGGGDPSPNTGSSLGPGPDAASGNGGGYALVLPDAAEAVVESRRTSQYAAARAAFGGPPAFVVGRCLAVAAARAAAGAAAVSQTMSIIDLESDRVTAAVLRCSPVAGAGNAAAAVDLETTASVTRPLTLDPLLRALAAADDAAHAEAALVLARLAADPRYRDTPLYRDLPGLTPGLPTGVEAYAVDQALHGLRAALEEICGLVPVESGPPLLTGRLARLCDALVRPRPRPGLSGACAGADLPSDPAAQLASGVAAIAEGRVTLAAHRRFTVRVPGSRLRSGRLVDAALQLRPGAAERVRVASDGRVVEVEVGLADRAAHPASRALRLDALLPPPGDYELAYWPGSSGPGLLALWPAVGEPRLIPLSGPTPTTGP